MSGAGGINCAILAAQEIFGSEALVNRPARLLGVLFIDLGVQMASMELVAELSVHLGQRPSLKSPSRKN